MLCSANLCNPCTSRSKLQIFVAQVFFAMHERYTTLQDSPPVRLWRMLPRAPRIKPLSSFPLGVTCVLEFSPQGCGSFTTSFGTRRFDMFGRFAYVWDFGEFCQDLHGSAVFDLSNLVRDFWIVNLESLHACRAVPISGNPSPCEVTFLVAEVSAMLIRFNTGPLEDSSRPRFWRILSRAPWISRIPCQQFYLKLLNCQASVRTWPTCVLEKPTIL